jgi:type IV conjugative transfer system protein TraE
MKENLFANSFAARMNVTAKKLRLQRNMLLLVTGVMIVSNSVLTIKLYNQETITRLVPTITNEQIISENFVNDEALRARAKELVWLLFSMKKENVDLISTEILKQVDNAFVDDFKQQIEELSTDIGDKNYRYVFNIVGYEFDNHNFTVKVQGHLETYMAGKQLLDAYKEYLISYINRGGVLMVKSFEEIKGESHGN